MPKLQQMLDERQGLLGDEAENIIVAARMCLTTALQIARHNLFLPVGVGIGAAVGPMLAVRGILRTMKTYTHTYDLLWTHGPTAMRFPLRRANSVRFFATFIAFQLCGFVLVVLLFAAASVVLVLLWEGDWPGAPALRAIVLTVRACKPKESMEPRMPQFGCQVEQRRVEPRPPRCHVLMGCSSTPHARRWCRCR